MSDKEDMQMLLQPSIACLYWLLRPCFRAHGCRHLAGFQCYVTLRDAAWRHSYRQKHQMCDPTWVKHSQP